MLAHVAAARRPWLIPPQAEGVQGFLYYYHFVLPRLAGTARGDGRYVPKCTFAANTKAGRCPKEDLRTVALVHKGPAPAVAPGTAPVSPAELRVHHSTASLPGGIEGQGGGLRWRTADTVPRGAAGGLWLAGPAERAHDAILRRDPGALAVTGALAATVAAGLENATAAYIAALEGRSPEAVRDPLVLLLAGKSLLARARRADAQLALVRLLGEGHRLGIAELQGPSARLWGAAAPEGPSRTLPSALRRVADLHPEDHWLHGRAVERFRAQYFSRFGEAPRSAHGG